MLRLTLAFLFFAEAVNVGAAWYRASGDAALGLLLSWGNGMCVGLFAALLVVQERRPPRVLTDALPDGSPLKPPKKWRAF